MPKFRELEAHSSGQEPTSGPPNTPDNSSLIAKRYAVLHRLGRGSFGSVYLVRDTKAGDGEALKVLKEIPLGDLRPNETVRATQEAQLLSQLHHPAILAFYSSFLERDAFCIITEYCQDKDLDWKLEEVREAGRSLPETQVTDWLIQLLLGLHYMHDRRILHRDLKAKNIFLKRNVVKIGDFGVSCLLMGSCDLATTFTGTPYYMSPEVLNHQGYDTKSDIWALGCILYEMCCLTHAFEGSNFLSVVMKIVEGDTPALPSSYSQELNSLMHRMLERKPSSRLSAAEALKTKFIEGGVQSMKHNLSAVSLRDKPGAGEADVAQIARAIQRKFHLQTLRERAEVEGMSPRERMRLRKLQAADEKAVRLRKLAEEKYQENHMRMKELRRRHFENVSLDVLNTLPITAQDYRSLGGSQPLEKQQHNRMCLSEPALHDIPEDPQTAEVYYNQDVFESCSDEEEEEEEDEDEEEEEEGEEEGADDVTPSDTFYQTDPQDGDLEAMMRQMEMVLEGEISGPAATVVESRQGPGGPALINSTLVETRIQRMRESVSSRLGEEVFQSLYGYLKGTREKGESEASVREGLSGLGAGPSDGFQVDQLLYYEEQLQEAKQQGAK